MRKSIHTTALTLVTAAALSPALALADSNPFGASKLDSGYQLGQVERSFGQEERNYDKHAEGKCGEGKCGADKTKAEGKCGEGKCGADKMMKNEGKCGEGKCGAGMQGQPAGAGQPEGAGKPAGTGKPEGTVK